MPKRIEEQIKKNHQLAYYGRVSTPRQKIQQQRDTVNRWLEQHKLSIPDELRFEDKGGRRHQSEKRPAFQALLKRVKEESIDWIVVASFTRWGVENIDEFFELRRELKKHFVRLYCINSDLELTGANEMDVQRITFEAMGATLAMKTHAEQNIMKMVTMAGNGQHASGAVPYGLDLECRTLADGEPIFRVHLIRKLRMKDRLVEIDYPNGDSVQQMTMPLRDGKKTGYWLVVGKDQRRIRAVQDIFRLTDQGKTPSEIRKHLWKNELHYYGGAWQDNAIAAVLDNPAFIGMPAWGKLAKGQYRQLRAGLPQEPRQQERGEPKQFVKPDEDRIYPTTPVFDQEAIISLDVWNRVTRKRMLAKMNRRNRPRQRNRSHHPLNGLLRCGECGKTMVMGKRTKRDGGSERGFFCGTYAKTGKMACRYYWTRISKVDLFVEEFLSEASGKLNRIKTAMALIDNAGIVEETGEKICDWFRAKLGAPDEMSVREVLLESQDAWEKENDGLRAKREGEAVEIKSQIEHIGKLLADPRLPDSIQKTYWKQLQDLQNQLIEKEPSSLSPFQQLEVLYEEFESLERDAKTLKADFLGQLVASISAKHELREQKNGTISKLVGFEVELAGSAVQVFGESKLFDIHTDRDSWQPPTSDLQETSRFPSLAKSSHTGLPTAA